MAYEVAESVEEVTERGEVSTGVDTRGWDFWQWFPFFAFSCLALLRIAQHGMWRDELQAWSLTRSSHTLAELFQNLRYEGHPSLWYFVLWIPTRLSGNPVCMQIIQGMIATAILALIWFKSKLGITERFLISGSHFFLAEYTVLSRSHGLDALLMLVTFVVFPLSDRLTAKRAVVLGLLANVSAFGFIVAVSSLMAEFWFHPAKIRKSLAAIGLVLGFLLAAILTVRAAPDLVDPHAGHWAVQFSGSLVADRLEHAGEAFAPGNIARALVLTPFLLMLGSHVSLPVLSALLSVALFGVALASLGWRSVQGGAFVLTVTGFFVLSYARYELYWWHWGLVFVCYVGLLAQRAAKSDGRNTNGLVLALLGLSCFSGLAIFLQMSRVPFSEARAASQWAKQNLPKNVLWVGSPDYVTAPIAGYLEHPLYYAECQCTGTFIHWSSQRNRDMNDAEREAVVSRMVSEHGRIVLILNHPTGDAFKTASIQVKPLAQFAGAFMKDESFYFYELAAVDTALPGND